MALPRGSGATTTRWVQIHRVTASVLAMGNLDNNGLADVLLVFHGFGGLALHEQGQRCLVRPMDAEAFATRRFDGS
jgi:hypothetical protein